MRAKSQVKQAGPLTLTIFGITGDLASRMLLPALYDLALQGLLPATFKIAGITRRPFTIEELLSRVKKAVSAKGDVCDEKVLRQLGEQIELINMDLADKDAYAKLRHRLDAIEEEQKICMNRIFYLAIPANLFGSVVEHLGKSGLNHSCPHGTGESRLLIEKPFGRDLASARRLITRLRAYFSEQQIYRIDHFLAKETAQNILTFRSQNALFLDTWDRRCISHILVSATETLGIEGRANFYEQTGALRDMIQSHVLQLLALATMNIPDELTAEAVHTEKAALLEAVKPAAPDMAIRGQYEGYRDESDNPKSAVETYAALQLEIAHDRWRGVPVLLRTGKALAKKMTTITIVFTNLKRPAADNTLTFQLGGHEGISLHLRAKKPGLDDVTQDVTMDFCYSSSFKGERQPSPYERVLVDAFRGDQTLFATSDEVLGTWRILDPLLEAWAKNDDGLHSYAKGSTGPAAADKLATRIGQPWPTEAITTCAVHIAENGAQA